ncbi:MAG: GyrI-like domain-containing protein, partial [Pyrinomonadaceae bacterium]|nr:GyrI-like domain-containing protein [Sphingobacteriaceae bacterium]
SPRRKEIANNLSTDLISLAVYQPTHFADFKLTNEFERWATVEVANFDNLPTEMETFVLPSGLYAVFTYKGLSSDNTIFKYILETWLPSSDYVLDYRPHFEVLGDKYKNNDPTSEEEIWIPIKRNKNT